MIADMLPQHGIEARSRHSEWRLIHRVNRWQAMAPWPNINKLRVKILAPSTVIDRNP